jgi:dihydropteroate synthase
MAAALDAGAAIINDVSGLTFHPSSLALVASLLCPVVIMHMRGTPATMKSCAAYGDVAVEVVAELAARLEEAIAALTAEATPPDLRPGGVEKKAGEGTEPPSPPPQT